MLVNRTTAIIKTPINKSSIIKSPTLINYKSYHLNINNRDAAYLNAEKFQIKGKSKKERMEETLLNLEKGDLTKVLNYNSTIFSNFSNNEFFLKHDWIIEKVEETEEGVSLLCASVSTSKKNVVYDIGDGDKHTFHKFLISQNDLKNFYTIDCVYKLYINKETYCKFNYLRSTMSYREGYDLDVRKESVLGLISAMKNNKFKEITINYLEAGSAPKIKENTIHKFKPMETSLMIIEQPLE